jgi:DNA-binding Lrp family transcriptional regulator
MKYNKMPVGYGIVQSDIMKMKDLSIQAKATYSYLASITGSRDYCFPKQETIAEDLGVSRQMVSKYLNELLIKGLIKKSKLYDDIRSNLKYEVMFIDSGCKENQTPDVNANLHRESTTFDSINNNIINNNIINSQSQKIEIGESCIDKKLKKEKKLFLFDNLEWKVVIESFEDAIDQIWEVKINNWNLKEFANLKRLVSLLEKNTTKEEFEKVFVECPIEFFTQNLKYFITVFSLDYDNPKSNKAIPTPSMLLSVYNQVRFFDDDYYEEYLKKKKRGYK